MQSEWVTYDVSIMFPTWYIGVEVFVGIMDSLSHQRKSVSCTKTTGFAVWLPSENTQENYWF